MNEIVPSQCGTVVEKHNRPKTKWCQRAPWIALVVFVAIGVPTIASGQFSVFTSIFNSIQSDMSSSLKSMNQIVLQTQKLYQTTMYPIAQVNQARGFVSSSITSYRTAMNQAFSTPFNSAVTPGPQQFELLLHSRQSSQIPSLGSSFTTNYGTIPQSNVTSPQDRVLLDMDDALGQQNLKSTLISDQADDAILQTANQMENQVAVSTPGSNPYLTAQTQIVNLRCQAYMQLMLAAELRQEAGRIAHNNVLVKRKATAAGNLNGLVGGALTVR
jgi:hypothetical protein